MRQFKVAVVALCCAGTAFTQPVRLTAGSHIKLLVADSVNDGIEFVKLAGRFQSLAADTMFVEVGDGGLSRIARHRITSIAVRGPKVHPYRKYGAIGTLGGFALGVYITQTRVRKEVCDPFTTSCRTTKGPLEPIAGALIGATAGLTTARIGVPGWSRVELPRP